MLYRNRRGRIVELNDHEATVGVEEGHFFPVEQPKPPVEEAIKEVVEEIVETPEEPTDEQLKALLKEAKVRGFGLMKREKLLSTCKELNLI